MTVKNYKMKVQKLRSNWGNSGSQEEKCDLSLWESQLCKEIFTRFYYKLGVPGIAAIVGLTGWLFGFYGISTIVGYLMPNPFLYK